MMRQRFVLLIILFITLALSVAPVFAQDGTLKAQTLVIINIRSGPGTEWRILGVAGAGTTVLLDGQSFGGSWVRGITSGGLVGWIFTDTLSISQQQAVTMRAIWVDEPFTLSAPAQEGGIPAPAEGTTPETTAPVAPIVNTAPVRGFSYGGHVRGLGSETVNWMRVAGMSWVKKQWRWEPGQDPGNAAGMIEEAHAHGFRILLGIVGDGAKVNDGGYFEAYASFVGGVAALGADGIEVWNEPNIDREWAYGSIDPGRYTELLRQSYYAIKGANANTLVVSGAPAPTGYFGGCSGIGCDDNLYLAGMAAAGAANYMDCVGVHYNEGILPPTSTSGDPRGNSTHYTRYYGSMVDVYSRAFGGSRQLCFTELGYLTPEGYGPLPAGFDWASNVTVGQHAAWLDQVVSMAANSGRIRLLIIWNVDFTDYGADPMGGYAMIRPGGDCPACHALGQ